MKDSKLWCFFLFQQAPSIKSQSSDTPLDGEAPLSHNLEGQVTIPNILKMKYQLHQTFTEQDSFSGKCWRWDMHRLE